MGEEFSGRRIVIDNALGQSYSEYAWLPRRVSSTSLPPAERFKTFRAQSRMKHQEMHPLPESDALAPSAGSDRQIRVLLAEDDRALRRFLEVVLERAGYRVLPACDGLEAMKLALSTPIDVVVTDAMMPNLSGHEFCRFLRNSQTLSHLPVILLSALERKDMNNSGEQADAFLSKPVSGETLIECIEKVMADKNGQPD